MDYGGWGWRRPQLRGGDQEDLNPASPGLVLEDTEEGEQVT